MQWQQITKIGYNLTGKGLLTLLLFFASAEAKAQSDFKSKQLTYSRVRTSFAEGSTLWETSKLKTGDESPELFIIAYKDEEILEVWARSKGNAIKVKQYDFCSTSGELGPKRREGDLQIPEGFYFIDRFNPFSNFYLSLGINYPNLSDRKRGDKHRPGSLIFIHGGCATIGCIPITDAGIKEVYASMVEAKDSGQAEIPVLLLPFRDMDENWERFSHNAEYQVHIEFWRELAAIESWFLKNGRLPEVGIDLEGRYYIADKTEK